MLDPFQGLLRAGETIPEEVRRCADFLRGLNIWHQFSRNDPVKGCVDAARRRTRLGHKGYHLRDELKTFCGSFQDKYEGERFFLAHCRGDRMLDFDKLRKYLTVYAGTEPNVQRANEAEMLAKLGMELGTVNPFLVDENVIQIFDNELDRPLGVPGTVMTNAGHHTWAVEFYARDFVRKHWNCSCRKICQEKELVDANEWGVREPKTIGILTGNPGRSGSDLHNSIDAHVQRLLGKNSAGDISMPRVIMASEPGIGISMELDKREAPLRRLMQECTEKLVDNYARARIVAHPAHTTSYFGPDMTAVAAKHHAQFISLVDATLEKVREMGLTEIALLGTEYVVSMGHFSAYRNRFDWIKTHIPSPEGLEKVKRLGYEVQQNGPNSACYTMFRDLLQREVPESCQYVLLLMTEFTPVLQGLKSKGHQGKILIDPIDAYGEAIAKAWLEA